MLSILPSDSDTRNLLVLWAGCFLTACSYSLVMPFLPQFIASLGVTENLYTWSGLTYAVSFISSAIMAPVWGNMADRYGRKPMIIRSGISIGIVYLLMAFVTNPYQLLFLRVANGAFAGFIPSSVALIATNMPDNMVGRSLALISTATAAGTITGPMIGGTLADFYSIRTTLQISATMMLLGTLLVMVLVREKLSALESKRTNPLQDLKIAFGHPHLAAVLIAAMMVSASIQSLEPILTAFVPTLHQESFLTTLMNLVFGRGDADAFISGFIFGLPGIAMVLLAARWSRLGERIGYTKVMTVGLFGAGLLALPQSLVTTAGSLILLRFVYGAMTAAVHPSVSAVLASTVHPTFRGRAFGINSGAMQMGAVIGASSGGLIADLFGQRAVFLFTGLLLVATAAWVYRALIKKDAGLGLAGAPTTTETGPKTG